MATLNAEGTQSVEGFIAQVKQVATLAEEEKLARQQRNCSTREADEADELLQAIASRRGTSQGTAAGSGLGGGAEAGAAGAGGAAVRVFRLACARTPRAAAVFRM